jgi:endonuclease YncB( thermonuclease family)
VKRTLTGLLAGLLICLTGSASVAPDDHQLRGRVVAIADGDTLTLLDASKQQYKIRLEGIDAPESGQPFGKRSKQSLSDLAFNIEARASCPKIDRYGRRVCKVLVGGVDVGLEQIKRGMAWHFKRYENEQSPEDRVAYATAEVQARETGRGLWRDLHPVPPWEWRKSRR